MKRFLVVALVLAMVLVVSVAAMAANGTWKMYASDSLGSLTQTDSQSASYVTKVSGVFLPETKVTGLEWIKTSTNADPVEKSVDYSSTITDSFGNMAWRINDNNTPGSTYNKMYITPASFDNSRGIVMARIKVNSSSSVNGTIGFSLGSTGFGMNLAVRNGTLRVKTADGDNLGGTVNNWVDPVLDTTSDYRVYALSWVGNRANVWYSNGNDWTGTSSNWTQIVTDYTMVDGVGLATGGAQISGISLFDAGSSNTWDGNISWIAHNTYDNAAGEMTPWDFNPAVSTVPEPGSIVALCSGLIGMVGFSIRRRRA